MFYIGLYRENMKKIFLSEIAIPRAFIVDLYQVWTNYGPVAPPQVVTPGWGLKVKTFFF